MAQVSLNQADLSRGQAALLRMAASRIEAAHSAEQIIIAVRAYARRAVGADGIAVILRDAGCCHYIEEDAIAPLWKGQRFPLGSCVSGWAMLHGRTAVIPDILADERVPQTAYRSTFVRSMAMAPMGHIDPPGAIGAYWAETYSPSPEEIAALDELARLAGMRLSQLKLRPTEAPQARSRNPTAGRWTWSRGLNLQQSFLRLLPAKALSFWKGQAFAAALVLGTAVIRVAITPLVGSTGVFSAFVPAVLLAALFAGPKAALSAIILATVAGSSVSARPPGADLGWIIFVPVAAFVALVGISARALLDQQRGRNEALEGREKQLSTIARELDHRSRNTLAVVTALTHQASHTARSPTEMRERLCGHFDAMARTQTSLLEVGTDPLPLKDLLEAALLPFVREGRVLIEIPPELISPIGSEVMLSLAFSELATNACKYGALSALDGEVKISGSRHNDRVHLTWVESGGPKVAIPERTSSGSRLIGRALAALAEGTVEASFLPAGATYRFSWHCGPMVR